jgi:predicted alpha/beta-hydrolase family hydrolase
VKVYLAPGWRGTQETIAPWVQGMLRRGFEASAVLPRFARAEQSLDVFRAVARGDAVIGGISFGGRVASMVAAEQEVAALICISYPLAGQAEARTRHWPEVRCPALIVNGEEDELADPRELRRRLPLLRQGRLHLLPGADHSLRPQLDQVLDLAAGFLATL